MPQRRGARASAPGRASGGRLRRETSCRLRRRRRLAGGPAGAGLILFCMSVYTQIDSKSKRFREKSRRKCPIGDYGRDRSDASHLRHRSAGAPERGWYNRCQAVRSSVLRNFSRTTLEGRSQESEVSPATGGAGLNGDVTKRPGAEVCCERTGQGARHKSGDSGNATCAAGSQHLSVIRVHPRSSAARCAFLPAQRENQNPILAADERRRTRIKTSKTGVFLKRSECTK